MAGGRPLGVKILVVMFVFGSVLWLIGMVLGAVLGKSGPTEVSMEYYRRKFFEDFPKTDENIKRFERMVPMLEEQVRIVNTINKDLLLKTQNAWNTLSALVWIALAIGLWKMKELARKWTVVSMVVSLVLGSLYGFQHWNIVMNGGKNAGSEPFNRFIPLIIAMAIAVFLTLLVVLYLSQRKVKEQFA